MKSRLLSIAIVLLFAVAILGAKIAVARPARQQSPAPAWNAAAIKECDRACLVVIMDGYMNAIFAHDPKAVPPLAPDVRMTENTGHMDVGEQACGFGKTRGSEEIGCRCEILDGIAQRRHEPRRGRAKELVIVNDRNE